MFEWWRERRREKILQQPFSEAHRDVLQRNVKHYARLDPEAQQRLRDLVQVFVAEKHWEGGGGVVLSDELHGTLASRACVLVLAVPHSPYDSLEPILVYPGGVARPEAAGGVGLRPGSVAAGGAMAMFGEAHVRAPVLLA